MKPPPTSISAYARHRKALGLPGGTPKAVRAARDRGSLAGALTKDGQIADVELADQLWAATTREDRVPLTGPTASGANAAAKPAPSPLQEHRARREAAQAELAEIELAEKRRELVPAKDVESRLVNVFSSSRTKILGVVARARQRDPSITPAQHALYESLLREALEDLADGR